MNNLCKCGCGNQCTLNYAKGHGRKGRKSSDEHKRKISESNKGKLRTLEQRIMLNNNFKGKKHSEETKQKMSEIAKKKKFGAWMSGKKLSQTTIEKCRLKRIGHITSDETRKKIGEANSGVKNGMYGKTHTDEYKRILSERIVDVRKNAYSKEAIKKITLKAIGRKASDKTKEKMRISAINRIIKKNSGISTRYNIDACKYLDELSIKMNWKIQHALNGGEFHIKKLGYFVDGYDNINNIVVEYDESLHYDRNNNLRERDIIRQNEIIKELNCSFYRYNEKKGELYEIK